VSMKAAMLTGIRRIEVRQVAAPRISSDTEVLLKVDAVGVCGSDCHYFETGRIGSQIVQMPFVLGHECAGTVVDIGSKVSRVRRGDQVAVDPAVACHRCDQCRSGRENTCRNLKFLGCPGQMNGGLCEQIVMPEDSLYPLAGKVTPEQAVLCEPLSIGLYAVQQAELPDRYAAAILGTGPIGLSVLLMAQATGVGKTYMTDLIDERVEIARQAKATWAGNADKEDITKSIMAEEPMGMDVVFECAGEQETIDQAVELLKPGGKLMLVGIPRAERISMVIDQARRKELSIINIRRQRGCVQTAIDLVATGRIAVDFMVTHRYSLDQCQEALETVSGYRDGVFKAVIGL